MDINTTLLERGVAQILPSRKFLEKKLLNGPIRLYQGFDPTAPSLHLGHLAGLLKLRQFQKAGHKVFFLIGDFTGQIGDPTDKLSVRQQLTPQQIKINFAIWKKQIGHILEFDGPNPAEIVYNSNWLSRLNPQKLLDIASKITYQQLIERDMFQKRLQYNEPIYLHELLYPLFQGYDSVHLKVDLEIGGTDQLFNMLMGRHLSQAMSGHEKAVMTLKLLTDKEGNKAGKTTGNALFFSQEPTMFFGGVMAIGDSTLMQAFESLTEVPLYEAETLINNHPLQAKKRLAYEIISLVWGSSKATEAQKTWEASFQKRDPKDWTPIKKQADLQTTILAGTEINSKTQLKRLLIQNAIEVNGVVVNNPVQKVQSRDKIKVGKKLFFEVV